MQGGVVCPQVVSQRPEPDSGNRGHAVHESRQPRQLSLRPPVTRGLQARSPAAQRQGRGGAADGRLLSGRRVQ